MRYEMLKAFKKLRKFLKNAFKKNADLHDTTREVVVQESFHIIAEFNLLRAAIEAEKERIRAEKNEFDAKHKGPWTKDRVVRTFNIAADDNTMAAIAQELNWAEQRTLVPDNTDLPEHVRNANPVVIEVARAADNLNRILIREGFERGVSVFANQSTGEITDVQLINLPARPTE